MLFLIWHVMIYNASNNQNHKELKNMTHSIQKCDTPPYPGIPLSIRILNGTPIK